MNSSHYRDNLKLGSLQNFTQNKVPYRRNKIQKTLERNKQPKYNGKPQQKLKKLCSNGSDKKIVMSWAKFRSERCEAFEASKSISKHISDIYFSMQENFKAKTTYFIFHSVADAEEPMKKYIIFDGKKI
ncbi:hypothetical protein AYI68_g8084 [Smittium mucronatum]|uniref:Uncharacterized protein n=1 Tax=Smittium mucronatum TaxID=133383 RepID=A0A1R0GLY1_9FUNG|nr:hypothetical protein AYI68_g8084 [Smittium mucronatum]